MFLNLTSPQRQIIIVDLTPRSRIRWIDSLLSLLLVSPPVEFRIPSQQSSGSLISPIPSTFLIFYDNSCSVIGLDRFMSPFSYTYQFRTALLEHHDRPLNFVLLSASTVLKALTLGVTAAFFDNKIVSQTLYVGHASLELPVLTTLQPYHSQYLLRFNVAYLPV